LDFTHKCRLFKTQNHIQLLRIDRYFGKNLS